MRAFLRTLLGTSLGFFGLQSCKSEVKSRPSADTAAVANAPVTRTSPYRLALDSESPGPAWRKLEPDAPQPADGQDVRSLAYLNPDLHVANIVAIHMHWESSAPDGFAAADIEKWREVYPDATFSRVERSPDGKYANFSYVRRREHAPTEIACYAFVRLPGARGLVRLTAEAHVEDGAAVNAAFRTVLESLRVKPL